MNSLKGRDFLAVKDFTREELFHLITQAQNLKIAKINNVEYQQLVGKNICLLFQKDSTRTRCAFEVAAYDQGAHVTFIGPSGSHFGVKESVADSAKFLSSIYDGIQFRGHSHYTVTELSANSSVPVFNGLTDEWHPTQMLADYLTIYEYFGRLSNLTFTYLGDARFNMANSYIIMGAKFGLTVKIGAPKELWPEREVIDLAIELNKQSGGNLILTEDPKVAVANSNIIATDVWVSMGEAKDVWKQRIELLKDYQVTAELLSGANSNSIFLHCLPSFHDLKTEVGQQIYDEFGFGQEGLEVTDEVFNSSKSLVFQQAENRMHTIKSVLVATLS